MPRRRIAAALVVAVMGALQHPAAVSAAPTAHETPTAKSTSRAGATAAATPPVTFLPASRGPSEPHALDPQGLFFSNIGLDGLGKLQLGDVLGRLHTPHLDVRGLIGVPLPVDPGAVLDDLGNTVDGATETLLGTVYGLQRVATGLTGTLVGFSKISSGSSPPEPGPAAPAAWDAPQSSTDAELAICNVQLGCVGGACSSGVGVYPACEQPPTPPPCAPANCVTPCPSGQVGANGTCETPPCQPTSCVAPCPSGQVGGDGVCASPPPCAPANCVTPCPSGQVGTNGTCVTPPCQPTSCVTPCPSGQFGGDGVCASPPPCAPANCVTPCPSGQVGANGTCVTPPACVQQGTCVPVPPCVQQGTCVPGGTQCTLNVPVTPPAGTSAVCYQLVTTDLADGLQQTFGLPLCVPTPVDVAATNVATPTTLVALCPIPLTAGALNLPAPGTGLPAQLYLSIQQLPGTASFPARFQAAYTVPAALVPSNPTIRLQIAATNENYPSTASVGGVADLNVSGVPTPAVGGVPAITPIGVGSDGDTVAWSTSGPIDTAQVGVDGAGSATIAGVAAGMGRIDILTPDATDAAVQYTDLGSVAPPVSISVQQNNATPGTTNTDSVTATWSHLPRGFVFRMQGEGSATGSTHGVTISGEQTQAVNTGFTASLDQAVNNLQTTHLGMSGLGSQFHAKVTALLDQSGNPTGAEVNATPGASASFLLEQFAAGSLSSFVELAGMPANASDTTIQYQGSGSAASAGVSVHASNAPAFVGAGSYRLPGGGVSTTLQQSVQLTAAGSSVSPPLPVPAGAQTSIVTSGVAPDFALDIEETGASDGVKVNASTPDGMNVAGQLEIQQHPDPVTTEMVLVNSLAATTTFTMQVHGTSGAANGFDLTEANSPTNTAEYKEFVQLNNGTPVAAVVVQRPGSNTAGTVTPQGTVATISNPDQSFSMHVDYTNSNGLTLDVNGTEQTATSGTLTLTKPDGTSVQLNNEFVAGDWQLTISSTSNHLHNTFKVHQSNGANAAGVLTASIPGAGTITLDSFATTTNTTLDLFVDASTGKPDGATVQSTNSEANPWQGVLMTSSDGSAFSVLGPSGPAAASGSNLNVVVHNVPQDFEVHAQRTGPQSGDVSATNPSPQPGETMTVSAPINGQLLQFTVLSFDTNTEVSFEAQAATAANVELTVTNSNTESNPTEVISGVLFSGTASTSSPQETVLLSGPSGNTTGLQTGGSAASVSWSSMPPNYGLKITGSPSTTPSGNGAISMTISGATADGASVVRVDAPPSGFHFVVDGTGSAQTLSFSGGLSGTGATVKASGDTPAGFSQAEAWQLPAQSTQNFFLTLTSPANTLPQPQAPTQTGNSIQVNTVAGQARIETTLSFQAPQITWDSTSNVTGASYTVTQWNQMGSGAPCSGGPCRTVSFSTLPLQAHLDTTLPDASQKSGIIHVEAKSSDSNLTLQAQTLVDGPVANLQLTGIPSAGLTLDYTMNNGVASADARPTNPTQTLPGIEIQSHNLSLPVNINTNSSSSSVAGLLYSYNISIDIVLTYQLVLDFHADAGLQDFAIKTAATKSGSNTGAFGVHVDGDSSKRVSLTASQVVLASSSAQQAGGNVPPTPCVGIGPAMCESGGGNPLEQSVAWSWNVTVPVPVWLLSDQDTIPLNDGLTGTLAFYGWETQKGNSAKLDDTGCSISTPQAIQSNWTAPLASFGGIYPFAPAYPKTTNALSVCGGHTAYFQINPEDLLFEHCNDVSDACPSGGTLQQYTSHRYSHGVVNDNLDFTTDWILAVVLNDQYSADPDKMAN